MKINNLQIKNFKSLKDIEVDLENLNLITGVNSSGKSSLIQSLLLLKQNRQVMINNILFGEEMIKKIYLNNNSENSYFEALELIINGEYTQLGNIKDILFEEVYDEQIEISIFSKEEEEFYLKFDQNLSFSAGGNNDFNIFKTNFQYIQTDRINPKISYPLSSENIKKDLIGTSGEYTAHYLAQNRHKKIINGLRHPKSQTDQLLENVSLWMSEISNNIEIKAKVYDELQQVDLKYSYTYGNSTTQEYTPLNVGFGITYVLPIVVSLLKATPGDLIIIENPETHLHPKAQSKIAALCAIAASLGVQIICETHSDHILNGVRVAIKNGIVKSENTKIYFLSKNDNCLETNIEPIFIDDKGSIDKYPNNFFDQFDKDLDELIQW